MGRVLLAIGMILAIGPACAEDVDDSGLPPLMWSGHCIDSFKEAPTGVEGRLKLECEFFRMSYIKGRTIMRFSTDHGELTFVSETTFVKPGVLSGPAGAGKDDKDLIIDHAFAMITQEEEARREEAVKGTDKNPMPYLVARGRCQLRYTYSKGKSYLPAMINCYVPVVMGDEEYENGLISSYDMHFKAEKPLHEQSTAANAGDHSRPGGDEEHHKVCDVNPQCANQCSSVGQPKSIERIACLNACPGNCSHQEMLDAEPTFGMTWTITNSTGQNLSGGMHSRDRGTKWAGYKIAVGHTLHVTIQCQADENICYGFDSSTLRWGVGVDGTRSCTNCCWKCGRAQPRDNLVP
jgi:hypothetical protein